MIKTVVLLEPWFEMYEKDLEVNGRPCRVVSGPVECEGGYMFEYETDEGSEGDNHTDQ